MSFEQTIRKAIQERTAEIADEEAKAAAQRVERRVKEATAEIAATVVKSIQFEHLDSQRLKIIVEFPQSK